ncbi:uncharacterized protein LOC143365222 [Halictus rubicundus]|uniref:uncharacterized protein LOC143365222 n=1 Tax=Halictus rubicundus TaxID=77578 RepID=UPI0040369533
MTKVNTYEILNQADDKFYTLYIEWLNSHFEVILLEPSMSPLNGKMDKTNIDYFCKELSKSFEGYVQETKEIFCGKRKEIQFLIDNTALQWKNNLWILGKIDLNPVSDIKMISESFQRFLKFYQGIHKKLNSMEEENKTLIEKNKKLKADIDKMIEAKTVMEQDMYKKFILILNSKKKKIQELECKMELNSKESVYDAPTDESEESDIGDAIKNKKRKTTDNKSFEFLQRRKCETKNAPSPEPSTSKECVNDDIEGQESIMKGENGRIQNDQSCISESRKSTSSLNLEETESDEDLFS